MRKLFPLIAIFVIGLFVADRLIGIDIPGLLRGFGDFLLGILKGSGK